MTTSLMSGFPSRDTWIHGPACTGRVAALGVDAGEGSRVAAWRYADVHTPMVASDAAGLAGVRCRWVSVLIGTCRAMEWTFSALVALIPDMVGSRLLRMW